ncbi:hypothetical protein IMCC3317_08210 [Kordia antarctica]|uniref:Uncharacterized protein n=1 Tax=Kordia antarctica TaxID=1218801 RepID=A0A7L4ZFT3_9FLAO|nr:hypothetical protein [Kordia antarctica]QHI35475.1 hypothetical protein IMCC3317_08210 [Kordia antarctica]
MSTITTVKSNEVYEGFDVQSVRKCTPSVLGFRVCAELTADGDGSVQIRITAETPFGNFSKTFSFNADVDFEFNPIPRVSIKISIRNFKVTDQTISFNLKLQGCIDLPFVGKKCVEKSFDIKLPMPGLAAKSMDELSSGDLALLMLAAQEENCQCN